MAYRLRFTFTLCLLFPLLLVAQPACNLGNYTSVYTLNVNDYPYTSGSSGISVSAVNNGAPTLSNFTYTCGGNTFNTASPAWWLNGASQSIDLTFSCPVTNFSVVVNGTNTTEEFYFATGTGTITLSNYCASGYVLTGGGSSLLYQTGSTSGTLITINNPTGSNTYTLSHNGLAAGSRIALLDCFNCNVVLPSELSIFDVVYLPSADKSVLSWETTAETNSKGFEVQHSIDGTEWEAIGFVDGAGNSSELRPYEFLHNSPAEGENMYRLKQLDQDGRYKISEVRTIYVDPAVPEVAVFPNPTSGHFEVLAKGVEGTLVITDMYGKTVLRSAFEDRQQVDLTSFAAGLYLVEFEGANKPVTGQKILLR